MNEQQRDRQFHIQCARGEVGRYCILPGDPGRCEAIAKYFDEPAHVQSNREYTTYTGKLLGEKVSGIHRNWRTFCRHRHGRALQHRSAHLYPGGHLRRY